MEFKNLELLSNEGDTIQNPEESTSCVKRCNKSADDVIDKAAEIRKNKEAYIEAHLPRNGKSMRITCTKCHSAITRSYIGADAVNCPVCGQDLRTESVINKIAEYDKRVEAMKPELLEALQQELG